MPDPESPIPPVTSSPDPLHAMIEQTIILDTQGPLIYIGKLQSVHDAWLVLTDADVHDTNDSRASKDLYIVESRNLGVRINRARVLVMRRQIASISLLHHAVD